MGIVRISNGHEIRITKPPLTASITIRMILLTPIGGPYLLVAIYLMSAV